MNTKILLNVCKNLLLPILFVCIIVNSLICTEALAFDPYDFNAIGNGSTNGTNKVIAAAEQTSATIIVVVRIACISIAGIILLVIAMKYMIAAPGERADIKKHAVPYVIGVVILFGTSGVLTVIGRLTSVLS